MNQTYSISILFRKMKKLLLILIACCSLNGFGQSIIKKDTINQVDSNGKKQGYWVVYLKKNFTSTRKIKKAAFYSYVKYIDGTVFHRPYFNTGVIGKQFSNIPDSLLNVGNPILLDGIYKLYSLKKGKKHLWAEAFYNKGLITKIIVYPREVERVKGIVNYEEKCAQNQPSYSYKEYSVSNKLTREECRILENGRWRIVRNRQIK